jgi:hypothetical protein
VQDQRAGLAIDPIRPYAYGGLSRNTVRRVNLRTGAVFTLFTAITGAAQAPVNVPVDGMTKYDYLAAMSDGSEIWAVDAISATGAACTRAVSFRVVTRPEDGTGHLSPLRASAPLIGQSASCPSISQLASSADGANLEVIGQNPGGTVAFFEGPRGSAVSEIASARHYQHLGVGLDGLKALSYLGLNGTFSDGVEVLDASNGLVHTFEQLMTIEGVRFSADDRFLVVIGNSQSAAGDLQVLKIQ